MTTVTQADMDALKEAEVQEAAALSLRAQAEVCEADALAIRAGVYAGWQTPVDPPVEPPVDPPVYDTLPVFKSGAPGAVQVYDLTGKCYNVQLNLRRLSFVHVIGGTYETDATSFYVDAGADITVEGATFTGAPMATINTQRCRIINSARVRLIDCIIIGGRATTGIPIDQAPPLDSTGNVIGLGTGEGIHFNNATDCGVSGCDISLLHQGIIVGGTVHLHDNRLHHIRTTAIAGSPGSGSTFLGNIASDAEPWQFGGNGDHGDNPIHFWTIGKAIDGLVINNNEYRQGSGPPTLGIFLQDKNGKFTNLTAIGNIIECSDGQGFILGGCSGLVADTQMIWTGQGSATKDSPQVCIKAYCSNLTVRDTVPPTAVVIDANMPPANRATITVTP